MSSHFDRTNVSSVLWARCGALEREVSSGFPLWWLWCRNTSQIQAPSSRVEAGWGQHRRSSSGSPLWGRVLWGRGAATPRGHSVSPWRGAQPTPITRVPGQGVSHLGSGLVSLGQAFTHLLLWAASSMQLTMGAVLKNPPAHAEDARDLTSIPGLGRSPEVGNGNLPQSPCGDNPVDRGATKSRNTEQLHP